MNHVYTDPDTYIKDQGITAEGITIEDDVWLGSNVVVVDGVRIGKGCVVGAGAVVTRDLAPYSVAVGVPARVVKDRREAAAVRQQVEGQVHFGQLESMRKK